MDGARHVRVCGLAILDENDVADPNTPDPRMSLVANLLRRFPATVHVGGLTLYEPCTQRALGLPPHATCVDVGTNLYGGDFFGPRDQARGRVVIGLREDEFPMRGDEMLEAVRVGAVAAYLVPRVDRGAETATLLRPFSDENEWLTRMIRTYEAVVVLGHDGSWFDAYSEVTAPDMYVRSAIDSAVRQIVTAGWYLANKDRLSWDDEWEVLVLDRRP